jgi:hypothetical protein
MLQHCHHLHFIIIVIISLTPLLTSAFSSSKINMREEAVWCTETQTYKGGVVPHHSATTLTIDELLACNGGKLKLFGYGSLCVRIMLVLCKYIFAMICPASLFIYISLSYPFFSIICSGILGRMVYYRWQI